MALELRLTEALDLERAGELQAALPLFLELWRLTRAPALATHIEQLSATLEGTLPPVDVSTRSVSKAIEARLKNCGPLDVGPLITAIVRATSTRPGSYVFLVELARQHPHDPRVASAVHSMILKPPFAGTEGAFYGDLVLALERSGDPRLVADIVQWSEIQERHRRSVRKERENLDLLRDAAARVRKRNPWPEVPWVQERLTHRPPVRKPSSVDAEKLLAAIYADPADIGPRIVYADLLISRNDPRGEFISLQCQRADGAKPTAREQALLKNHGRAWLGALESSIRKQGLVYRRGFIAQARECNSSDDHLANPAWNTLEALELDSTSGAHAKRFFGAHAFPVLRRLIARSEDTAELKRRLPSVRELGFTFADLDTVQATLEARTFPNLEIVDMPELMDGVGEAFRKRRIKLVRLSDPSLNMGELRGLVDAVEIVLRKSMFEENSRIVMRFSGPQLQRET
ncbi:MAG: TIGR02996 domain-containing protein [Archangium sp.]|nr:TIGR02996 domain-containing protein [Archangium sp.]